MNKLDKFYTKDNVAQECIEFLKQHLSSFNKELFLEPSAGSGVFLPYLPRYEAYDIQPEGDNIQEADFLKLELKGNDYVTIGNPPYGKRSKLAIDFFNHAAAHSKIVAFILPVSFMKWGVQKQLNSNFKLLAYKLLQPDSFTDNGKDFAVRTVFQIWTREPVEKNLRILHAPPISHPDFQLWQYNATPEAMKYVDTDWTYACYRQGYKDYNSLFTKKDYDIVKEMMEKNIQFFFIRPLNTRAEAFMKIADFEDLAARNTATPGFGKADFVSYYQQYLLTLDK